MIWEGLRVERLVVSQTQGPGMGYFEFGVGRVSRPIAIWKSCCYYKNSD